MTDTLRLAGELSRALDQLGLALDDPDPDRAQIYMNAAKATIANVRAELWSVSEPRPIRKPALVGRYEESPALIERRQIDGRESRFRSTQPEGCGTCLAETEEDT